MRLLKPLLLSVLLGFNYYCANKYEDSTNSNNLETKLEYTISQSRQNTYKSQGFEKVTANLNKPVQYLYLNVSSDDGGDLSGIYLMTPSDVLIPKKGYKTFEKDLVIPTNDNSTYKMKVSDTSDDFSSASPTINSVDSMVSDTVKPSCSGYWNTTTPSLSANDKAIFLINCDEDVFSSDEDTPPEYKGFPVLKVQKKINGVYIGDMELPRYTSNKNFRFSVGKPAITPTLYEYSIINDLYDKANNVNNAKVIIPPITWQP